MKPEEDGNVSIPLRGSRLGKVLTAHQLKVLPNCFNPLAGKLFGKGSYCNGTGSVPVDVSIPLRGSCLGKGQFILLDPKDISFQSPCGEVVWESPTSISLPSPP